MRELTQGGSQRTRGRERERETHRETERQRDRERQRERERERERERGCPPAQMRNLLLMTQHTPIFQPAHTHSHLWNSLLVFWGIHGYPPPCSPHHTHTHTHTYFCHI